MSLRVGGAERPAMPVFAPGAGGLLGDSRISEFGFVADPPRGAVITFRFDGPYFRGLVA